MEEENLLRGKFVYKNKKEFSSLVADYVTAIEYFDQLYSWAKELGQRDIIITSEFDEIEEALAVGGAALRRSAELSAKSISDYDAKPRDDLIKRVNEVLHIRRGFMQNPKKQIILGDEF
ncbi:hypothetical protein KY342_00090 [Candidatus Woesearchaeota archaeon]|nr:hypothetical protein [Candidatus Woesearchaeota archaeon]